MVEVLPPDAIEIAAAALAAGQLVAFPTETVYGLGADAGDPAAVTAVFEAKGRPSGHPLIVHLADPGDLDRHAATVTPEARKLAAAFWPGPLTLVVARGPGIAAETVGGLETVGIRVPDHPVALDLLRAFGGPVAAPSANRFGSVSPTTAEHVIEDLGRLIDYVLDGGPCPVGVESTIVDVTGSRAILLRPGGIAAPEIESVIGAPVVDGRSGPVRASGMLASHYAPNATVRLVEADQAAAIIDDAAAGGARVGLIAPFADRHRPSWQLPDDATGYATALYATLRAADRRGLDLVVVVPPSTGELRDAVLDRLYKAAAPRPA